MSTTNIADWDVSFIDADGAYNGDVIGDLTGNVTGDVKNVKTTYTSSGTIDLDGQDVPTNLIELIGSSSASNLTEWTPAIGSQYVIYCSDSANNCAVSLTSGITFDGTNDFATFEDSGDTLIVYCVSSTRLVIVENIGAVALS